MMNSLGFWEGGRPFVLSSLSGAGYLLGRIGRIWEVRICHTYIDERFSIEAHCITINLSITHVCYFFMFS
jgi:hypothetical protein